jgi:hypothetical protein
VGDVAHRLPRSWLLCLLRIKEEGCRYRCLKKYSPLKFEKAALPKAVFLFAVFVQCMSPLLAQSVVSLHCTANDAIGPTADKRALTYLD